MKPKRWKQIVFAVLGIIVIIGVLAGIKGAQFGKMMAAGKAFVPPPEAVTTTKVEDVQWGRLLSAVGTLVAVRGATIGAEVGGTVKQIAFESGAEAKAGQLLVKLDTSIEQAQLAAARADASLAKLNLDRSRQLRNAGANSQAEMDTAEARGAQSFAAVQNAQAMIAKKTIRAPFAGRLGIRQIDLGQVIAPGAPIVSLQSFDPIYAEFSLPQQALAEVAVGQATRLTTDTFPGKSWEGKVSAINPEVDASTRNVRIQALFENDEGQLRPGMFVNVQVSPPEQRRVLSVPSTAVIYAPYGDSVYTVSEEKGPDGKPHTIAKQTFVRTGEKRGDIVEIASGLEPGQQVITSGAFKLKNGMPVVAKNDLAPDAALAPTPQNQ